MGAYGVSTLVARDEAIEWLETHVFFIDIET
jgi:hypothetical protein